MFGGNFAPVFTVELVFDKLKSSAGYVDPAGGGMLLHSCGYIYGITPYVTLEFMLTHNACHHRPCMNANP